MRKIKIIILSVIASLAMVNFANAQEPTLNDVIAKYNEGANLMNTRNYMEAAAALQQAVEMGSAVGESAMENVQNAQKLIPKCYFYHGLSYAKTGKAQEAITEMGKAIEFGERYNDLATVNNAKNMTSKLYTMLAAEAFNNKDYAKAADIFSKGYTADPKNTDLAMNLAMSYCEMGELDKGVEIYNNIIALGPTHSKYEVAAKTAKEKEVYYLVLNGSQAEQAGNNDKAVELIDKALVLSTDDATANTLRVQLAAKQKDFDKIIEMGDKVAAMQTTPELKSNIYFYVGAAYDNKTNTPKAIEYYKKVIAGANAASAKAQVIVLNKK